MIKRKLATATAVGLIGMVTASLTLASDMECDESCRASIDFQNKLDSKDMEISLMQKELSLMRLSQEISALSKGGDASVGNDAAINELAEKIEALNARVSDELEKSIANESGGVVDIEISIDTTGIENVFVTETRSVGSEWQARVFYNNSAQDLYVGEQVFPGAEIKSIDRRGIVVSLNGDSHHKMITPIEIAQARTFNNIKEERALKREEISLQRQNSGVGSYGSPYF